MNPDQKQLARLRKFDKSIPSAYRFFKLSKYPRADIAERLLKEWPDSTSFDERPGLLLYGPPRSGKTRLATEIVRRRIESEYSSTDALFLSAVQWANEASSRARNSELYGWVHEVLKFAWDDVDVDPIVIIDDVDKVRATPVVQSELFNLIEVATANEIPLIVTTNTTSKELAGKFDPEFGEAIVSRLREFCTLLCFDKFIALPTAQTQYVHDQLQGRNCD